MKLTVNISKTKLVIFTNSRISNHINFIFKSNPIEVVPDYKYLGIYFLKNGSFTLAKKGIAGQANEASLHYLKTKDLCLPYDLQLDFFNKTLIIMPQLGLDVGGNFNIHIWACSGDFIVRNRWTGHVTV